MSDSAFLTTDLSQDTTELIIPLLFSFLLVELKLILRGMTAEAPHSKSWARRPGRAARGQQHGPRRVSARPPVSFRRQREGSVQASSENRDVYFETSEVSVSKKRT